MLLGALETTPKLMRIDCSSSVSRLRAHATVCVRFCYVIVSTHDLVIDLLRCRQICNLLCGAVQNLVPSCRSSAGAGGPRACVEVLDEWQNHEVIIRKSFRITYRYGYKSSLPARVSCPIRPPSRSPSASVQRSWPGEPSCRWASGSGCAQGLRTKNPVVLRC